MRCLNEGWYAGKILCLKCSYEHVAVWPEDAPVFRMECPECGARDSVIEEYY